MGWFLLVAVIDWWWVLDRLCNTKEEQGELLERCVECWSSCDESAEDRTVEKLANFVTGQDSFSWGQIIELLEKGSTQDMLILKLCERLLMTRSTENDSQSFLEQKDVLMHYVIITSRILKENQV